MPWKRRTKIFNPINSPLFCEGILLVLKRQVVQKSIGEISYRNGKNADCIDWHVAQTRVAIFRNERSYGHTDERVEAE